MRTHTKLMVTALAAALLLAAAIGTASANRLSVSNRNIRATFDNLTLGGALDVVCDVTIEGSFHSATISKVANALVGFISRATTYKPGCTSSVSGRAEVNQTSLPWHIRYQSFSGTLPNITGITLTMHEPEFTVLVFGGTCIFRGTMRGIVIPGTPTRLRAEEATQIPRIGGTVGGFCGEEGNLTGTGTITLLGNTTNIAITLI